MQRIYIVILNSYHLIKCHIKQGTTKMKIFLVISILFSINSSWGHLDDKSDSGIWSKKYSEIIKEIVDVHVSYPDYTELIHLGQSHDGKETYAILIKNRDGKNPTHLVSITGATHGNEYLNIVDRLPESFLSNSDSRFKNYLDNGGAIFIVPILNPDGYDRRMRRNSRNADLNRDFPNSELTMPGLFHKETNNVVNWLENYIKKTNATFSVAMDYHCCNGSLLYPWSWTDQRIPDQDLSEHIVIGELMKKYFKDYIHGITGEILGYYPRGTSKDFWYQRFKAKAFTFEGQRYEEKNNLSKHINWWGDILEHIQTIK
jgi:hypothetical protein